MKAFQSIQAVHWSRATHKGSVGWAGPSRALAIKFKMQVSSTSRNVLHAWALPSRKRIQVPPTARDLDELHVIGNFGKPLPRPRPPILLSTCVAFIPPFERNHFNHLHRPTTEMDDFSHLASLANAQVPQHELPPPLPDSANGKRKADDEQAPGQQRAKRNRYISIACNVSEYTTGSASSLC